jgi:dihydrolipoamide dehydrogenase
MYDLTVIGAGWAGFNACMKARSLGLKSAIVERSFIGGTCLNKGCIPTKTLIQSAKLLTQIKKSAAFGIKLPSPAEVSFAQVQDVIQGDARILGPDCVKINDKELKTKWILVATGSVPSEIKALPFDGSKILSSDHILSVTAVPKSLLIVGGGVIGCEFAGLFAALGSGVTLVELTPQLIPGMDADIARKLESSLKKKGITVRTSCDVTTLDRSGYEKTLVCVGRRPAAGGLGLVEAGVTLNKNSSCIVNDCLATNVPSIYAAGDCTGSFMLAHYAAYQGRRAVSAMSAGGAGENGHDPLVPSCIFTDPEIAFVGLTEDQAKQKNMAIKAYRFDFMGSGMARIMDETDGYVKILSDEASCKILGASIIGPKATELISTLTVAIQAGMTVDQLANTILPHPTLSESITEALHKI